MQRYLSTVAILALFSLQGLTHAQDTAGGQWKTAFVKRGFVGAYQDGWLSGPESVVRSRTPIPFTGTKVKVFVSGAHKTEVKLKELSLVKGADDEGKVVGPAYPILFEGKPTISFTTGTKTCSDEIAIPITKGTWYVQDSYLSSKMPYAYDVDRAFCAPKGSEKKDVFTKKIKARVGIVTRIDVFTTDKRPSILCYGDSITHGYNSSPNKAMRYPDQLEKLLDRPVLNLGVNGDVIKYARGMPGAIAKLKGIDTVIFLMGINDIIGGMAKDLDYYTKKARPVIDSLKKQKIKVYIGTILPASGYKKFDKDPAKEKVRQEINQWIRTSSKADGVIDFDAALRDPAKPSKLKAEYQSDWLHPNDAGYTKMAETAAKTLKK